MAPRRAAVLRHGDNEQTLRDHLIATAEQMIATHGTGGLTVRAIARQAGVADGVLYNHFANKEELLADALRAHVRTVERGLGELPGPGTATVEANLRAHLVYGLALHRAVLPAFTGLLAQPAVLIRFAQLNEHEPQWRDRLTTYLRAERDQGRLPPDAQVDAAAAMIVGICHETALSALLPHAATASAGPSIESLISVVLGGIGR